MHRISKALAGLLALPLCACATAPVGPSREEVDGLRAAVAQLRARQVEQDRELARLRARLDEHGGTATAGAPAAAAAAPAAEVHTSAEASAVAAPQVPENLKVVYVAPDPVPLGEPQRAAREPSLPRRRPAAAPAPLPTDTPLREPTVANAAGLSPEALEVAFRVARAAPDSADALEHFAQEHPDAPQSDNALFEAGLRAERDGQADRAARDFERVVREHPAGDCVADALLHLAGCQLQLHKTDAARATLARITTLFPGTAQAEAAQVRLTDLGG